MDIIKIFGTNLRKFRLQAGLSQEQFAEKCGLHRTYISDIERFRRSIALENVGRIATALNLAPDKLFAPQPAIANCTPGTPEASEALIRDLYLDLRVKVNAWSSITNQTPQARMGYIGQHLVSIVTGFPGGKSGARGSDLIMNNGDYGEIKTCYRVDQLGSCADCGAAVSSLEDVCTVCGSSNVMRKDDSKWLISLRSEEDFARVSNPKMYYFVLFEFEDINDHANHNIIASIWAVDPKVKGFVYCLIDHYLNRQANSKSKAPFDMWPYSFKFALTQPQLIYRSIIQENGDIRTSVFPTFENTYCDELAPLPSYSKSKTLTLPVIQKVISAFSPTESTRRKSKATCLNTLESMRVDAHIPNATLCDAFADAVYLPLITPHKEHIPDSLKDLHAELR